MNEDGVSVFIFTLLQVELDFRALFPDVSDKLYMVWTVPYVDEVLKYASLQSKWQSYLPIHTAKMGKFFLAEVFIRGKEF